jgi:hypothetical protein
MSPSIVKFLVPVILGPITPRSFVPQSNATVQHRQFLVQQRSPKVDGGAV